jgi:hypothetical protein
MKKITIITLALLLLSVSPALAKNEQAQNQTQTQNVGEENRLNVQVEEIKMKEISTDSEEKSDEESPRSALPANAQEKMSVVSQKVHELLSSETETTGIGDQVRQVARLQNQAQEKIQTEVSKMASRSGLLKGLFGPDWKAIGNLNEELAQNQLRIQKLQELKTEVVNQAEETQIQETVEALVEQNTALESQINQEEGSFSLFGWLVKLFNK